MSGSLRFPSPFTQCRHSDFAMKSSLSIESEKERYAAIDTSACLPTESNPWTRYKISEDPNCVHEEVSFPYNSGDAIRYTMTSFPGCPHEISMFRLCGCHAGVAVIGYRSLVGRRPTPPGRDRGSGCSCCPGRTGSEAGSVPECSRSHVSRLGARWDGNPDWDAIR